MNIKNRAQFACPETTTNSWRHAALAVFTSVTFALAATAVQAQVAVSSSGTPSYAQAIAVPPGIGGMQPNLSLLYSGGGVNGPVGHGWSVQGISMITRCPATRQTDGLTKGVAFASSDKLCLDGQRLIQTDANGVVTPAAVYDVNGKLTSFPQVDDARGLASGWREYRTEKDSFARIRAYGIGGAAAANGPAYFKVWTKAGQIYEYGAAPSVVGDPNTKATVLAQGKTVVMVWAVARVSDVVGNYIDFKYEQRDVSWGSGATAGSPTPGHEWNIAEIQYTGNSSNAQPPANKVVFRYIDRTVDRSEAYQQGSKNVSVRLLAGIDTYVNSSNSAALGPAAGVAVKVRSTNLAYDNAGVTKRSRLTTVVECTGAATPVCQPPVRFNYANGGNDAFVSSSGFKTNALATTTMQSSAGGTGVITGDFNGDGRTDLIVWANNPLLNKLYLSQGDGTFIQVSSGTGVGQFNLTDVNLFSQSASTLPADNCFMTIAMDINGDGLVDLLRWASPTALGANGAACSAGLQSLALLSNGDGSFQKTVLSDYTSLMPLALPRTNAALAICGGSFPLIEICFNGGSNFYVGDFNGDGYQDIVEARVNQAVYTGGIDWTCKLGISQSSGTPCFTSIRWGRGDGSFSGPALVGAPVYSEPNRHDVWPVDFDGDGLADLVIRPVNGSAGGVALVSQGNGQFTRVGGLPACSNPGFPQFADLNGDGRADFICAQPAAADNKVYISNGGSAYVANASAGGPLIYTLTAPSDQLVASAAMPGATYTTGDLNGDGRSDILRVADDPTKNVLYLSNGDGTFSLSGTFAFDSSSTQLLKSDNSASFAQGDFLGNGTGQLLRLMHGASTATTDAGKNQLYVKADPTPPDQLISVVSPAGLKTTLTYGSLASLAPPASAALASLPTYRYYSDRRAGTPAAYPLVDLTIATPVVITSDAETGVGANTVKTEYAYRGLKAASDGRGLLGFRQSVQQNIAPNGDALSVFTDYWLDEPYAGTARRTETRKGNWNNPSAQLLSTTTNTYCDLTSATNPDSATDLTPCATNARLKRPYLRKSIEEGLDLGGNPLPKVTSISSYDNYLNATNVGVTTEASFAGANQVYTKISANTFCAPDTPGCPNKIAADNWILGRLTSSTVTNTVPNLLTALTASAGNAPNATATAGNQVVSVPISPAVLSAILQLLLED